MSKIKNIALTAIGYGDITRIRQSQVFIWGGLVLTCVGLLTTVGGTYIGRMAQQWNTTMDPAGLELFGKIQDQIEAFVTKD